MSKKKKSGKRFFSGGKVVPSQPQMLDDYGELQSIVRLVYDIPSENIKDAPAELKKELHSMRNRLYNWLKNIVGAERISGSEWLFPDDDALIHHLETEFIDKYIDFYDAKIPSHRAIFSWYRSFLPDEGIDTLKAQILRNKFKDLESLLLSIESHIQWHKNWASDEEYELAKLVDPKTKRKRLSSSNISTFERRLIGLDVLLTDKDFVDKSVLKASKIKRQNVLDQLSTVRIMIEKAREMYQKLKDKERASDE